MATVATNFAFAPRRPSTETDRRFLLADSVAPSESASMIDFPYDDGERTPRARSPARAKAETSLHLRSASEQLESHQQQQEDQRPRPYRGFPSEEAYIAALREWAETKKYLEPGTTLYGFYGQKTLEEYAQQPGLEIGLRKKWRARKERKLESVKARAGAQAQAGERRNTVA